MPALPGRSQASLDRVAEQRLGRDRGCSRAACRRAAWSVGGAPTPAAARCQDRENVRSSHSTGKPAASMVARIAARSRLHGPPYQRGRLHQRRGSGFRSSRQNNCWDRATKRPKTLGLGCSLRHLLSRDSLVHSAARLPVPCGEVCAVRRIASTAETSSGTLCAACIHVLLAVRSTSSRA